MEDGRQPLCYSVNLDEDMRNRCSVCRREYGMEENLWYGSFPCYCEPGTMRYRVAVVCKVFVTTTPAHDLDITTPLRYDIYDLSGKLFREIDQVIGEVLYDHWNEYPVTHTVVLDGSMIEDSYRDILSKVKSDFTRFDWDFKGKHSHDRYVDFAEQRIYQIFNNPQVDLKPENDHFGQRKKGTSHASRASQAKGGKSGAKKGK